MTCCVRLYIGGDSPIGESLSHQSPLVRLPKIFSFGVNIWAWDWWADLLASWWIWWGRVSQSRMHFIIHLSSHVQVREPVLLLWDPLQIECLIKVSGSYPPWMPPTLTLNILPVSRRAHTLSQHYGWWYRVDLFSYVYLKHSPLDRLFCVSLCTFAFHLRGPNNLQFISLLLNNLRFLNWLML